MATSWRNQEFLNDEQLLSAAEQAALELEEIRLDNNAITDDEGDSDDDWDEQNIQNGMTNTEFPDHSVSKDQDDNNDIEIENGVIDNHQIKGKKKDKTQRKWHKKELITVIPVYSLPEGPVEEYFLECITYTDYFLKMLGTSTLRDILYQSNLYGVQRNKPLNLKENELLSFIGINFLMGYHKLPSYKNFWNSAQDLGVPLVIKTMTKNRFEQILGLLHLNDNSSIPPNNKDKIYKLRPFVESLNEQFEKLYHGTRELAVDESMILFKGRSTLKQYNPMKPIKRGYKLWCIADQKGYVKQFQIYQGKDEVNENKFQSYGLGERVVLSLIEKYWSQDRKIYFDNYFTTVNLLEKLKSEQTLGCGTIRSNRRDLPVNMKADKDMVRGDTDYRISDLDISFFKWRDNKTVNLLSNFHGTNMTTVSRLQKDGSRKDFNCPEIIRDYNNHMGAVDHADRLRQAYCVDRRSKKWWHRLFFGLLDMAFVNSYVVYKEMNPDEHISLFEFRRGVTMGLMNCSTTRTTKNHTSVNNAKCSPRSSPYNSPSTSSVNKRRKFNYSVPKDVRLGNLGTHWPVFTKERRRCEQCSSMAIESRPHSKCSACDIYLCVNEKKNCFSRYHNINE